MLLDVGWRCVGVPWWTGIAPVSRVALWQWWMAANVVYCLQVARLFGAPLHNDRLASVTTHLDVGTESPNQISHAFGIDTGHYPDQLPTLPSSRYLIFVNTQDRAFAKLARMPADVSWIVLGWETLDFSVEETLSRRLV